MIPPVKVTFDTSTLEAAVAPESHHDQLDHRACVDLHKALDALGRNDKVDMVGGATIASRVHSTGRYAINISIGLHWTRPLIDQRFLNRIRAALALGMRALVGPRLLGYSLAVSGFGEDFYAPSGSPEELVALGEKTNRVDLAPGDAVGKTAWRFDMVPSKGLANSRALTQQYQRLAVTPHSRFVPPYWTPV